LGREERERMGGEERRVAVEMGGAVRWRDG